MRVPNVSAYWTKNGGSQLNWPDVLPKSDDRAGIFENDSSKSIYGILIRSGTIVSSGPLVIQYSVEDSLAQCSPARPDLQEENYIVATMEQGCHSVAVQRPQSKANHHPKRVKMGSSLIGRKAVHGLHGHD